MSDKRHGSGTKVENQFAYVECAAFDAEIGVHGRIAVPVTALVDHDGSQRWSRGDARGHRTPEVSLLTQPMEQDDQISTGLRRLCSEDLVMDRDVIGGCQDGHAGHATGC